MANAPIAVATLTHDDSTRKYIPTVEHQSIMQDVDKNLKYVSDVEVV